MTEDATPPLDDTRLSKILQWGLEATQPLRPDELRAIWQHELESPLAFDLAGLPPDTASQLRLLCDAEGLLLKSLNDLLKHPTPPLKALELVKDFAKASAHSPHGVLPRPVAAVLYYACIAVALLRHNRRISQLTDRELEQGFAWVLAQPWMTDPTRAIIEEARHQCLCPHV